MNDERLESLALRVREHVIDMAAAGGCFLGAALSCTDLLAHLYARVLDVTPARVGDPTRDYLFLSKGHAVPALYGTLAELGFFPAARLARHLTTDDSIYWHPNRALPGVELHSGSLGHLLAVAVGVALDLKLSGTTNRCFVVLGDGECNEGSIWEACLVAKAKGLDNLIAIVDRNDFQANLRTEELIPLEPLGLKFEAFGWKVRRVNGHDFAALDGAFGGLPVAAGAPTCVIADTVRGKGLPSIEARADRWFVSLGKEEADRLLLELRAGRRVA